MAKNKNNSVCCFPDSSHVKCVKADIMALDYQMLENNGHSILGTQTLHSNSHSSVYHVNVKVICHVGLDI